MVVVLCCRSEKESVESGEMEMTREMRPFETRRGPKRRVKLKTSLDGAWRRGVCVWWLLELDVRA